MAKKHKGHYCKMCGEYKSNESFSGKGHAQHICKEFMGEMKKGYKKILDLPFGDNEFEIVDVDEYTDTFWRIGHFALYFSVPLIPQQSAQFVVDIFYKTLRNNKFPQSLVICRI